MTRAKRYGLTAAFNRVAPPPPAPRDNTIDVYHGVKIADPFRPLENLDAAATSEWVEKQNERFQRFIENSPALTQTRSFLERSMNYSKETMPARYGERIFSHAKEGLAAQYDYYVQDHKDAPRRLLINANTMSADGTVSLRGVFPCHDGSLVAYATAEAGENTFTLRIRNVETGEDLPDVIKNLPSSSVTWDRNSTYGFIYYTQPNDGKRRFVCMHHNLGADVAADNIAFSMPEEDSYGGTFRVNNNNDMWASGGIGTSPHNGLWRRAEGETAFKKIFDHGVASYNTITFHDNKLYMTTTFDAPLGKLVAVDLERPEPENWQTIIPEHKTNPLHWAMMHQGVLLVEHGVDTADQLGVYDLSGRHLHDAPTPIQSTLQFARVNAGDTELLLTIANFQQPGALYSYDFKNNLLDLVKPTAAPEPLEDCIVERIHATSKDGTQVPMTIIRHPDTKLDGSAAVKLYGYGGFNIPLTPDYSDRIAQWVRAGGIYVQANLRGGGEYGSEWYDQGRLLNKQNVFDDFAACAEKLIADHYTTPRRLVIEGGSNGGLLTLATMLQRPELFGAVISDVPVTDMLRFDRHTNGAAWRSDYGNSNDNRADFEAASKYSPLHNVRRKIYPPVLVNTGDHDTIVVPSHAYKFVATMQAKAHPDSVCLLRVDMRTGHGQGKPTAKIIQEMADTQAFIERSIGPIHQDTFRAEDYLRRRIEKKSKGHTL